MKKLFIVLSVIIIPICSIAQDSSSETISESSFTASLELTSKYIWRGIEYGTAPATFPMLSYSSKGFNVFALGAYVLNGSHQELDYGLSYTFRDYFTLGLSDYYYPSTVGEMDQYFNYKNSTTGHSVEAYVILTPFRLPFWVTLSTYVYGADKGLDGRQAFSSYAELGYAFEFDTDNSLSLIVGANLNKGFYTDYTHSFNVVNAAVKYSTSFEIGNFKLPVSVSYILNPFKNKGYFTFSLYINS